MLQKDGGITQAAALLFFAFTGYARIATLGEEVRSSKRTIPRAVILTTCLAMAASLEGRTIIAGLPLLGFGLMLRFVMQRFYTNTH